MSVKFLLLLLTLCVAAHARDRYVFDYSRLMERADSFDFTLDTTNTSTILSYPKNETKRSGGSIYQYILDASHQLGPSGSLCKFIQYASFLPLIVNILIELVIRLATRNELPSI